MNVSTTDDLQAISVTPPGQATLLELTHELEKRLRVWSMRLAIAGEDATGDLLEALTTFMAFLADEPH
jgi:hypothetical protein